MFNTDFFPLDVSFLIKKFLKQWKPDKIFLVDSEIWPNLIIHARNYKIPLALINARLSKNLIIGGQNLKKLQRISLVHLIYVFHQTGKQKIF